MKRALFVLEKDLFNHSLVDIISGLSEQSTLFSGVTCKEQYSEVSSSEVSPQLKLKNLSGQRNQLKTKVEQQEFHKSVLIRHFEEASRKNAHKYSVSFSENHLMNLIIRESAFSDFIAFSSPAGNITGYRLAEKALCPAFIIPELSEEPDHIILPVTDVQSIHKLKLVSYLLKDISPDKKVTVLAVFPETAEEVESEKMMLNLFRTHFAEPGYLPVPREDFENELLEFTSSVSNPLFVSPDKKNKRLYIHFLKNNIPLLFL